MSKLKNKIKHDHVCDICGKPATINIQGDGWVEWTIDKNGNFTKEKEWGLGEGDNNEFYCNNCKEKHL